MKVIKNLFKMLVVLSFSFADECRQIESQDECSQTEGCFWNEDLNYCQSYDNNDWEDECRFLEDEYECIDAGCMWDDEEGCYGDWDEENDDGPPECVMDCEGIEDIDPDEDPFGFCEWIINLDDSCLSDCDDETIEEIIEIYNICEDCLENDN